jgi:uncharacterized protein (DUF488 family)
MKVFTIGHSTLGLDAFLARLRRHRIDAIADVRRYPGSRRHPHFAADALAESLPEAGIAYLPMKALGGRRSARKDSRNVAWRNEAFRGYADYMETAEYAAARDALVAGLDRRTAIMCAETLWWRCHRSLISDDLKARGIEVLHILGDDEPVVHPWTGAARIVDGRLDYGAPQTGLF